jgi:metal-responsive CopG/Arc/MetJ family transcriptional regulator
MPNQRSKNKLLLGGFVEKELHQEIARLAKKEGMESNRFGFVQKLILEALEQRKKKQKQKRARARKG